MTKHQPTRIGKRRKSHHRRAAAILVWFALLLPLLLGITGLVVDAGLLMASHRHLQNSVDAAAMAAASDLVNQLTDGEAIGTATEFVKSFHNLADAKVDVFTPPQQGPYAGEMGFVEVIAEYETPTIFIQFLNGVHKTKKATARAVAGAEANDLIDGILALDHRVGPGLTVTGNAVLSASGRIIVNSEFGGVDQDGNQINNGKAGVAGFVSPFATVKADEIYLVGGVNRADRFQNIDAAGGPALKTGQLPVADPFIHLPTPTVGNGVVDVRRGSAVANKNQLTLINPDDDVDAPNYIETNQVTGEQTLILNPGIYSSINISGGKVRFRPGIYVMAPPIELDYSVAILDGEIEAQGIMFYNTKANYDPWTGDPDASDGGYLPEFSGADKGQIRINAGLGFSGIDTLQHAYVDAASQISDFNGMLIYQRRRSISTIQIQGFTQDQELSGKVYAKWAKLRLPAGGVLNSQLVVGTLTVPGHGNLHVKYGTDDVAQSLGIYLVE